MSEFVPNGYFVDKTGKRIEVTDTAARSAAAAAKSVADVAAGSAASAMAKAEENAESISALTDEIEELKGGGDVTYEERNYPAEAYTFGYNLTIGENATVDVTALKASQGWAVLVIPCKAGTTATITGEGGAGPRAWALVADDGAVLNRCASNTVLSDYELRIEQDCTLVLNSMSNRDHYVTLLVPVYSYDEEELLKERFATDAWFAADAWIPGYITTSAGAGGTVDFSVTESTNYKHMVLDCYEGMRVNVTGRGGDNGRLWCFSDREGTIISVADAYATDTEIIAPIDGKIIINVENAPSYPQSVKYTPYSLKPIAQALVNLMPTFSGALMFADGANLKYETPEISAMPTATGAELLTHYYGLYDALVTAYPDYVSKVDCDAEVVAAGIVRPDHMSDYPIYMYKFIPAYASNSNALDGVTSATKFKAFIVSGTHPEYMSIWDLYNTMRLICEQWKNDENLEALRWQCEFYVIPLSGPYGVVNGSRTNYNGVDLNRNAPSSDWVLTEEGTNTYSGASAGSEYETKVLAHYMEQIKPHVFIDHHNTNSTTDRSVYMYITTKLQSGVDVAASHISAMSRRWKKRFADVLPDNDTLLFGFSQFTTAKGARATYGHECGARSYTFESQPCLGFDGGELVDGAHNGDAVASTIATDGFINFLLLTLRNAAQRISAQVVD